MISVRNQCIAGISVVLALVTSCAGPSGGGSDICSRVERESLAEDSAVHVIATASAQYASLPPTSGAHAPGPELGIYQRNLRLPEQVGVLERGDVVIQYDPARLTTADVDRLESTFGSSAVVFPSAEPTDVVVATAWRTRLRCSSLDNEALSTFIETYSDAEDPHPDGE